MMEELGFINTVTKLIAPLTEIVTGEVTPETTHMPEEEPQIMDTTSGTVTQGQLPFGKKMRLGTFTMAAQAFGHKLHEFDLYHLLFESDVPVFGTLNYHSFFSSGFELTVFNNATATHCGLVAFCFAPPGYDPSLRSLDGANNFMSFPVWVTCDLSKDRETTIKVPYSDAYQMHDYNHEDRDKNNRPRIYAFVIAPLKHAAGAPTTITFRPFLSPLNLKVAGIRTKRQGKNQRRTMAVRGKVLVQPGPGNMPFSGPHHTDARPKMGLMGETVVTDIGCTGFKPENDLLDYAKIPGIIAVRTWEQSATSDTMMYRLSLNPIDGFHVATSSGGSGSQHSHDRIPIEAVSSVYAQFTGSIKIGVQILTSVFNQGRLVASFTPDFDLTTSESRSFQQASYLWEVGVGTNEIHWFTIPYIHNKPYATRADNNGSMRICVDNPLTANASAPTSVDIIVYACAGDDFQLAVPKVSHIAYNAPGTSWNDMWDEEIDWNEKIDFGDGPDAIGSVEGNISGAGQKPVATEGTIQGVAEGNEAISVQNSTTKDTEVGGMGVSATNDMLGVQAKMKGLIRASHTKIANIQQRAQFATNETHSNVNHFQHDIIPANTTVLHLLSSIYNYWQGSITLSITNVAADAMQVTHTHYPVKLSGRADALTAANGGVVILPYSTEMINVPWYFHTSVKFTTEKTSNSSPFGQLICSSLKKENQQIHYALYMSFGKETRWMCRVPPPSSITVASVQRLAPTHRSEMSLRTLNQHIVDGGTNRIEIDAEVKDEVDDVFEDLTDRVQRMQEMLQKINANFEGRVTITLPSGRTNISGMAQMNVHRVPKSHVQKEHHNVNVMETIFEADEETEEEAIPDIAISQVLNYEPMGGTVVSQVTVDVDETEIDIGVLPTVDAFDTVEDRCEQCHLWTLLNAFKFNFSPGDPQELRDPFERGYPDLYAIRQTRETMLPYVTKKFECINGQLVIIEENHGVQMGPPVGFVIPEDEEGFENDDWPFYYSRINTVLNEMERYPCECMTKWEVYDSHYAPNVTNLTTWEHDLCELYNGTTDVEVRKVMKYILHMEDETLNRGPGIALLGYVEFPVESPFESAALTGPTSHSQAIDYDVEEPEDDNPVENVRFLFTPMMFPPGVDTDGEVFDVFKKIWFNEEVMTRREGGMSLVYRKGTIYKHYGVLDGGMVYHLQSENVAAAILEGEVRVSGDIYDPDVWVIEQTFDDCDGQLDRLQEILGKDLKFNLEANCESYAMYVLDGKPRSLQSRTFLTGFICTTIIMTFFVTKTHHQSLKNWLLRKTTGVNMDEVGDRYKALSEMFKTDDLVELAKTIGNSAIKLVIISIIKLVAYIILIALNPTLPTTILVGILAMTDGMIMAETRLSRGINTLLQSGEPEEFVATVAETLDPEGVTTGVKSWKEKFRLMTKRQGPREPTLIDNFNKTSMAGKNVQWWVKTIKELWAWLRTTFFPSLEDKSVKFIEQNREHLSATLCEADYIILTATSNASVTREESFRDRFIKCMQQLVVYKRHAMDGRLGQVESEIGRAISGLTSRVTLPAFRPPAPVRTEPVGILLVGAPGQGKTQLMTKLAVAISDKFGNKKNDIFAGSKVAEFMDGYYGQAIHMLDDINQIKPESDLVELCNLISGSSYIANKADLNEKGQPYCSKILLATSNCSNFDGISTVKSAEALTRRFKTFHIRCSEAFRNDKGHMNFEKAVNFMDQGTCWEYSMDSKIWFICNFPAMATQIHDMYLEKEANFKKLYPDMETKENDTFYDTVPYVSASIRTMTSREGPIALWSLDDLREQCRRADAVFPGSDEGVLVYMYYARIDPKRYTPIHGASNLIILGRKWKHTIDTVMHITGCRIVVLRSELDLIPSELMDILKMMPYVYEVYDVPNYEQDQIVAMEGALSYGYQVDIERVTTYHNFDQVKVTKVADWIKTKLNAWKEWVSDHKVAINTIAIVGTLISAVCSIVWIYKEYKIEKSEPTEQAAAYAQTPAFSTRTNVLKRQGRITPEGWEHLTEYIMEVEAGGTQFYALMYDQTTLLVNAHFCRYIKRAYETNSQVKVNAVGISFETTGGMLSVEDFVMDGKICDLMFLKFRKQAQVFRVGKKHFAALEKSIPAMMPIPSTVKFEKKMLGNVEQVDLEELAKSKGGMDNVKDHAKYVIDGEFDPIVIVAQTNGSPGYCGLPWLAQINGTWKIVGLHSAGSRVHCLSIPVQHVLQTMRQGKTVKRVNSGFRIYTPSSTAIKPSVCHGVFEVKTEPAVLTPRDARLTEEIPSIIKKAADKYHHDIFQVDESMFRLAEYAVAQKFKQIVGTHAPVDVIEAINKDDLQEGIDMTTSAGFPYAQKGIKKKDLFVRNNLGKWIPTQRLLDDISRCEQELGEYSVPFVACLKDERRKLERIETGATRCIEAAPVDYVCAYRKVMKGIYDVIYNTSCVSTGIAVGMNPYTDGSLLRAYLGSKKSVVTMDYKTFDGSIPSEVMRAAVRVLSNCSTVPEQVIKLHEPVVCSKHLVMDEEWYNQGGMPSGSPCTSVLNSLCNLIVVTYCMLIQGSQHVGDTVITCYGDDVILGTDEPEIFGKRFVEVMFESFGMTVTREDKKPVDDEGLVVTLAEASFLKRRFVEQKDLRVYIMALHKEVMEQSVMWTTSPYTFGMQVNQSMTEMAAYGEEEYNKFAQAIKPKLNKHVVPSYQLSLDALAEIVGVN